MQFTLICEKKLTKTIFYKYKTACFVKNSKNKNNNKIKQKKGFKKTLVAKNIGKTNDLINFSMRCLLITFILFYFITVNSANMIPLPP